MFHRILTASIAALALTAAPASALTVRDVIELTKAGLGESVLLTLIEVDRSIFAIDTATLKQLKQAGVSDTVIVAMIRSGRTPPPSEALPPQGQVEQAPPQPMVDQQAPPVSEAAPVVERQDVAPPPVYYPVAVPVYVPTPVVDTRRARDTTVKATIATDQGIVKANVPVPPNCVKAEPVYWGWGGKLRPGSWEPPPTVVCR